MKALFRVLIPTLVLTTLLVSACTGVSAPLGNSGGGKVEAAPVEFTGVIEAMNGNQWAVNGQTFTVDPAAVNNGPFNVGDTVKVEAEVQADGSIVVTRVEAPVADTNLNGQNSNDDNGNSVNSNDGNVNDTNSNAADSNSNDVNVNDTNSNDSSSDDGNINDDNGNESMDDNGNSNDDNDDSGNEDDSNSNGDEDDSGSSGDELNSGDGSG